MDKTIKTALAADETAEARAGIRYFLGEIQQAHKRMKKDQADIERLKSRTKTLLAKLKAA